MEIKGVVFQHSLYSVENNDDTKVKKDVLKGIKPTNEHVSSKSNKEKSFSKFSSEKDIYGFGFQTVTKNIMDLNAPLCDTGGGGFSGGGGG